MKSIKDIDKEHNGYVTITELDDILKINYKKELTDKNLKEIFKPFASIQNRILIDYKKFRDFLLNKIKAHNQEKLEKLRKNSMSV
jgi:Ca2+-binding EF-hand superfamily protein